VGTASVAQQLPGRVQHHVHLLGVLWLALSAFNAVGGLFSLILGSALFPHLREMQGVPPDVPVGFPTSLFSTLGAYRSGKSDFRIHRRMGLLQREAWARMFALVLTFISLFDIPFGATLGVYTLWALLPSRRKHVPPKDGAYFIIIDDTIFRHDLRGRLARTPEADEVVVREKCSAFLEIIDIPARVLSSDAIRLTPSKPQTQIYSQGPHSERIEGIPRWVTSGKPVSDSTTRD